MPYDPVMIQPFRDELLEAGFKELVTASDVDAALAEPGRTLLVVNSVCGCAAGQARPGVARAVASMAEGQRPHLVSVFAGQDLEATARARSYFTGYAPSSPNVALLENGKVVFMLQRYQIQVMDADAIARTVAAAVCSCVPGSAPAARPLDLPAAGA
jgi:putative YphP/YqiW family bacilliredoxin